MSETLAHERIQDVFHRFSETIQRYGGIAHELRGDALVAEFERASDAVEASLAFQAENTRFNSTLEDEIQPTLRVGISLGEVVVADNTVTGEGIVLAQRLEQLASGGGVCIQGAVYEAVPGRLPFDYESLGEQELKGFSEPVRAYAVSLKSGEVIPAPEVHAMPGESPPAQPKKWWIMVAAMALLVVVGGGLAWLQPWVAKEEPTSSEEMAYPLPDKPSIAVLPFENISGDPEQEYFSDGMTDDIITDLSKLAGLFVIARNSTFAYKGTPIDVKQVARELGVRYVLEGSVRRADDRVRINAQLIDGTTGGHVWADRYDRDYRKIFALQDEVITHIVAALQVRLGISDQARLAREPTTNIDAYDLYLRAEQARHRHTWLDVGIALGHYDRAISLDPDFAEAHAGYAQMAAEFLRVSEGFLTLPADVARARAYESVTRALSLDPELASAHSVLGILHVLDGQYDEAVDSARKAVALNLNSAGGYANLALVLMYAGRQAEALPAIEAALRLEPNPPPDILAIWARVLFMNHDYAQALDVLRRARAVRLPKYILRTRLLLAMIHAELGQVEQAREELQRAMRRNQTLWWNVSYFRRLWAHHKQSDELDHELDALRKAGLPEWPSGYEDVGEERLGGAAIGDLLFGATWRGRSLNQYDVFAQKADEDGNVLYHTLGRSWEGKASVEGDRLCYEIPAILLGRRFCGVVYRNPDGTPEERNEYVAVDVFDVHYFSLQR